MNPAEAVQTFLDLELGSDESLFLLPKVGEWFTVPPR